MMTAILMAALAFTTGAATKHAEMKKFVLVVRVPETYGREQAKAVNPEWDKTIAYWKATGAYVESFAFPAKGYVISGADKRITQGMVASGGQIVVSIVVLQAESLAQATELAKRCPVLNHGGVVEVRERP
ncbi:YciI family protein [Parapedobacter koreensis]|uniref:YCII-related domain-containing protein n=1 Tax=Parapedobacter koreensis TaxID=332977 RepID=A0A1H7Q1B1_9SPHI|nr:YciI family protein [Parapedobacter koreensis]SEL41921.1 YCII-related domain-containing protein [Parapedobacter koreensis]